MLLTEEEAKQRWCPQARVSWHVPAGPSYPAESGYAGNRDANGSAIPHSDCIASACMAWRWVREDYTEERVKGFCGLAGRAE